MANEMLGRRCAGSALLRGMLSSLTEVNVGLGLGFCDASFWKSCTAPARGGPASTGAGRCREQRPCPRRAGQGEGLAGGLRWLRPCNLKAEGSEMAPCCSRLCAPSARRLQVGDVTAVGFWGSTRYKRQCKRTFFFSFFFSFFLRLRLALSKWSPQKHKS